MKKEYQINKGQAVGEFQAWAKQNQQPVQLTIPTADIVELAQSSLGDLRDR